MYIRLPCSSSLRGYIIDSLGILVGFSWEQSFDGGVEVLSARTPRPQQTQLALAVAAPGRGTSALAVDFFFVLIEYEQRYNSINECIK